jgi:hypothetical protein
LISSFTLKVKLICGIVLFFVVSTFSYAITNNTSKSNNLNGLIPKVQLPNLKLKIIENEAIVGKLHRYDSFPTKYITPRTVDIWLPNNYDISKKYTVLYMNDGQDLFDPMVDFRKSEMEIDESITRLIKEAKIKDAIVAGGI